VPVPAAFAAFAALAIAASVFVCDIPAGFGKSGNAAYTSPLDGGIEAPGKRLTIVGSYHLPIAELSGLARTAGSSTEAGKIGGINLYAVGDASHEVVRFRLVDASNAGQQPDIRIQDVAHLLGRRASHASQWEAVAVDGKESVCMLSETHADITCLDTGLQHVEARFTLDVSGIAGLDFSWKEQPNSRGEGMILMKRGHALVLKEKRPSMLIEFGPEGDAPMGYGLHAFLAPDEKFAGLGGSSGAPATSGNQPPARKPAEGRLVALKAWEFSDSLHELARDASEITLGPDGRVYLLSQESATLIRLKKTLESGEHKADMEPGAYWRLPDGLDKAEGLVIDDGMHPWVGIDMKQTGKPNLFRLSPVGGEIGGTNLKNRESLVQHPLSASMVSIDN
jgi:hypothetical protein